MGSWSLYFLLKLFLYAKGAVAPLWSVNLLFIVLLAYPIQKRWIRTMRTLLAIAFAIPLLYYESTLPPFARAIEEFGNLKGFTPAYMAELLGRFVPADMILIGLAALLIYYVLNRWVRVSAIVLIVFLAIPLWGLVTHLPLNRGDGAFAQNSANDGAPAPLLTSSNYEAILKQFRQTESQRLVTFDHVDPQTDAQFDVIVLQICSLSWDDLDTAKAKNHPLLRHFDYLFSHFSSAASYSGPAAIRLLRADCGQNAHKDLYSPAPQSCNIFSALAQAGFTPQIALNHDGRFDDFIGDVTRNIGIPGLKPFPNEGATVGMKAFDGSPVRDDYAVLSRWWQERSAIKGPVALFYNTMSLHDGNQLPNSHLSSTDSYPLRLNTLMTQIDQFSDLVAASGRKAVLVFIPQHGAALRGAPNHIAGLRDIPTPHIVNVPVGVKLIGFSGTHPPMQIINTPTSYLALAQLLANMVANSPFKTVSPPLSQYAVDLPHTEMIGENEDTVTLRTATGYMVRTSAGDWVAGK
jgi:cellulose synthase operon protein YhjU